MPPSFLEKSNTFFINIRKSFYTGERESMPNSNLVNAKNNMKSRIRNRVSGSNPRDLGRLAKSARFVGLTDDAEVETDIDTEMAAAIPAASVDDLVEMSEGLKELRTGAADMGSVANADNLTEGENKFLNADSVQPQISVSGDLSYNGGVVSYTAPTASALQVVATVGDLPAGASAGDQAVVQSNNKLYIKTADGWYAVALINTAPSISGNDASYTLATDQTPTVVTMTATDPENDPVTFSYAVTSGDLNGTTVQQSDNVFTITPHGVLPATFELTFSANDSVNVATSSPSSFTLAFSTDWSAFNSYTVLTLENPQGELDSSMNWTTRGDADWYGSSVAVSENYYVVGSNKRHRSLGWRAGAYYLYDKSGTLLQVFEHFENFGEGNYQSKRGFGIPLIVESKGIVVFATEEEKVTSSGSQLLTVEIYSISTGNLVSQIHHASWTDPSSIDISSDENTVYIGAVDKGIGQLNITDPANPSWGSDLLAGGTNSRKFREMKVHNNWIIYSQSGAYSGTSHTTGTEAGYVTLYNLNTGASYDLRPQDLDGVPQTNQSHKDGFDATYRLEWYQYFGYSLGINDNYIAIGVNYTYNRGYHGVVLLYAFDSTDDNASTPSLKGWFHPSNATWPNEAAIMLREGRAHDAGPGLAFGSGCHMTEEAIFISSAPVAVARRKDTGSFIIVADLNTIPTNGNNQLIDLFSTGSQVITITDPEFSSRPDFNEFGRARRLDDFNGWPRSDYNFAVNETEIIVGAHNSDVVRQSDGTTFLGAGRAFVFKATT